MVTFENHKESLQVKIFTLLKRNVFHMSTVTDHHTTLTQPWRLTPEVGRRR